MIIHTFMFQVLQKMQDEMGENVTVSLQDITKNNGVVLTGLTIAQKNVNISPTIYLEDFYEEYEKGKSMEDVMEEIKEIFYRSKMDRDIDMKFFTEYEQAKKRIVFKLINYDKNRELLKTIPHREYLDLAVVYYYLVDMKEFSNATILIHNKHMESWQIDEETLYELASKNTPQLLKTNFCGMMEVLKELAEEDFWCDILGESSDEENGLLMEAHKETDATGMYVLSNQSRLYGAGVLLYEGVPEQCREQLGSNFFILPSSVHEVILVPDLGQVTREKLGEMVREVNATQVEEQEQLSDFVYYYDGENRGIVRL
ncbi:MAG: hypothetical protein IJ397_04695 [Lachnospiraceae bacterium]|nr:hypothetical protein [Lachnospiraceae bacterium]